MEEELQELVDEYNKLQQAFRSERILISKDKVIDIQQINNIYLPDIKNFIEIFLNKKKILENYSFPTDTNVPIIIKENNIDSFKKKLDDYKKKIIQSGDWNDNMYKPEKDASIIIYANKIANQNADVKPDTKQKISSLSSDVKPDAKQKISSLSSDAKSKRPPPLDIAKYVENDSATEIEDKLVKPDVKPTRQLNIENDAKAEAKPYTKKHDDHRKTYRRNSRSNSHSNSYSPLDNNEIKLVNNYFEIYKDKATTDAKIDSILNYLDGLDTYIDPIQKTKSYTKTQKKINNKLRKKLKEHK